MSRRARRSHLHVVLGRWWHRFVVLTDPTAHRRSVAARKAAGTRRTRRTAALRVSDSDVARDLNRLEEFNPFGRVQATAPEDAHSQETP